MPYGVSMKLFKKSFQKGWRIFSPPNAEPSKRFLTLTETRSFDHGATSTKRIHKISSGLRIVNVKLKVERNRAPFSP